MDEMVLRLRYRVTVVFSVTGPIGPYGRWGISVYHISRVADNDAPGLLRYPKERSDRSASATGRGGANLVVADSLTHSTLFTRVIEHR